MCESELNLLQSELRKLNVWKFGAEQGVWKFDKVVWSLERQLVEFGKELLKI